jgi:hypothetical protein
VNRAERRAAGQRGPQRRQVGRQTFWNGEPTPARRVRVVVGAPPEGMPLHWLHSTGLVGKTINAVEVSYSGWPEPMYLYDEDGSGWHKVTEGHGGPRWGHRNVPVERIVGPAAKSDSPAPGGAR